MAEQGGMQSKERIYVSQLPSFTRRARIQYYDANTVENVYLDMDAQGFSFIMIPAFGATHRSFALNAPRYKNFAAQPLIGWITGVGLEEIGRRDPVVIDGTSGQQYTDGAMVMHLQLPLAKVAQVDIINIFRQGEGDVIEFLADGFEAHEALIAGQRQSFADYLKRNAVDLRLPLVADYAGAMINTSFQSIDAASRVVKFYAPVFRGMQYRIARPHGNYLEAFAHELESSNDPSMFFSCNCILNYLYAGLEGKKTGNVTGPITFGEIAYQLLNQTLVYMTISDV